MTHLSTELLRQAEIEVHRLGMADMEVSVGLRRETRDDGLAIEGGLVGGEDGGSVARLGQVASVEQLEPVDLGLLVVAVTAISRGGGGRGRGRRGGGGCGGRLRRLGLLRVLLRLGSQQRQDRRVERSLHQLSVGPRQRRVGHQRPEHLGHGAVPLLHQRALLLVDERCHGAVDRLLGHHDAHAGRLVEVGLHPGRGTCGRGLVLRSLGELDGGLDLRRALDALGHDARHQRRARLRTSACGVFGCECVEQIGRRLVSVGASGLGQQVGEQSRELGLAGVGGRLGVQAHGREARHQLV